MVSPEFRRRLQELAHDRISGAREILGRLLHTLRQATEAADDELALELALATAHTVLPEHPSMAPLLNALDAVFRGHEQGGRDGVIGALDEQIGRQRAGLEGLVERARNRLQGYECLATLSWSSTVANILAGWGRPLRLLVAESRPGAEGRRTATRLAAAGHEVRFFSDAAFPAAVTSAEVLLLGADALTPVGLVNKVGSLAAAREARMGRVPVLATLEAGKVVGPGLAARLRIRSEPADLVWSDAPGGVRIQSELFEVVPLDLVDEVLGPEGAGSPGAMLQRASDAAPSGLWDRVPLPSDGRSLLG